MANLHAVCRPVPGVQIVVSLAPVENYRRFPEPKERNADIFTAVGRRLLIPLSVCQGEMILALDRDDELQLNFCLAGPDGSVRGWEIGGFFADCLAAACPAFGPLLEQKAIELRTSSDGSTYTVTFLWDRALTFSSTPTGEQPSVTPAALTPSAT